MIGIRRFPIPKSAYRQFYRGISNMPIDDQKVKSKSQKQNLKESTDNTINAESSTFNNYNDLLQDPKGDVKVCIIGGCTASIYATILLKQSRLIKCINLIDLSNSMAKAIMDLSHIDTSTRVKYFKKNNIREGLREANIIAIMDEADSIAYDVDPRIQFKAVSDYMYQVTQQMVQFSPDALVVVCARPVTATLPMVSEIYKLSGWWDPDRIIGSTSYDCMRMEAITANLLDLNPAFLSVPMVGGADPHTIVPLLSCSRPVNRFTITQENILIQSLRGADKEMANIESRGPTISAGAAVAKLIHALADGLSGFKNVVACAFVRSNVLPVCRYFTSELQFGTAGVLKNIGLPKISSSELLMIEQRIPLINECVEMAIRVAHSNKMTKVRRT